MALSARNRRQREVFVAAIETDLIARARRTARGASAAPEEMERDVCQFVHDEVIEMGHRGRLAFIYRFLGRYPALWAASVPDVAEGIWIERAKVWLDYGEVVDDELVLRKRALGLALSKRLEAGASINAVAEEFGTTPAKIAELVTDFGGDE
jgi:hypothetical protein